MRHLVFLLCAVLVACSAPSQPPVLTNVVPAQVDSVQGGAVELRGAHLRPAVTLDFDRPARSDVHDAFTAWLDAGGARVDLDAVTWVNDGLLSATVPGGVAEGRYDVHLVDPAGREAVLVEGLEVVDCFVTACLLPDGGTLDAGAPDAGMDTLWTPCADFTYQDLDLDTFGRPDSGDFLCGPYRTAFAGDCNDRDALTNPGAAEVCNGLDDDCNGEVDEGACAVDGGPVWKRIYAAGPTWMSAWSWTPGGLWVGGEGDVRVTTDGGGFSRVGDSCPENIAAVWAQSSGRAHVGGGNMGVTRISVHELGAGTCRSSVLFPDAIAGLVGFPSADGGVDVVGVLRKGDVLRGEGALASGGVQPSNLASMPRLADVHGVAPDTLFAVGDDSSATPVMKAYRLGADGGWQDEHVERLALPRGSLNGVWVLDAERVVAVGDDGVVIERTPFGWYRLPDIGSEDLSSVRAFSLGRVYVVGRRGKAYRWDGTRWDLLYDGGASLQDVTGTGEGDLWAVGAGGSVVHWPEAP